MAIDRIDWHWDGVTDAVSDDEHWERAGAHIGYYIEWAFNKGWANPDVHSAEDIQDVLNSNINGLQYLMEYCDAKFLDDDLNEEGKRFTSYAYHKYVEDFEKITGHKMYTKNYNRQDLQAVFKYLDEIYENYLNNPQQIQAKNESRNAINEKILSSKLNQIVLITFVLVIFAVMIYGIVLAFTLI